VFGVGRSEGPEPGCYRSSDPMREAGGPSTEVVELVLGIVHAPPGIVMVALQTLLSNASMAQT
jgi:hypothetical protein